MAGKHPHLPGLSRLVGGITSGISVCLRLIFLQGADCTTRQRVTPTSLKNLLQLAENVILCKTSRLKVPLPPGILANIDEDTARNKYDMPPRVKRMEDTLPKSQMRQPAEHSYIVTPT